MQFHIIPNWHPFFVHFTIAFLLLSPVLFAAAALARPLRLKACLACLARLHLWLGASVTVATVAAGFSAFNSVAHGSAAQHVAMLDHRAWALPTAALFATAAAFEGIAVLKRPSRLTAPPGRPITLIVLMAAAALCVTAYKGAEVVYRHGIGVLPVAAASAEAGHAHEHHAHAHPPSPSQEIPEAGQSGAGHDDDNHNHQPKN